MLIGSEVKIFKRIIRGFSLDVDESVIWYVFVKINDYLNITGKK